MGQNETFPAVWLKEGKQAVSLNMVTINWTDKKKISVTWQSINHLLFLDNIRTFTKGHFWLKKKSIWWYEIQLDILILTAPSEINRRLLFHCFTPHEANNTQLWRENFYTRRGKTTSWNFVRYDDELLPTSWFINIHDEGWASSYRQSNVQSNNWKKYHALLLKITFTFWKLSAKWRRATGWNTRN